MYAGSACWSPALLIRFKPIATGGMVPPERLLTACKGGGLRKHKMPAVCWWSHSTRLWRSTKRRMYASSVSLQLCRYTSSLLPLVEWFHQKDHPLHAKVGASGSINCLQFIGGAIPSGSRSVPSKRRMYAGSVGLQVC